MRNARHFTITLQFVAALALSSCAAVPDGQLGLGAAVAGQVLDASGAVPPAPGRATLIDDKALIVALQASDTLATSVDALVGAGYLVPGTPRALAVRDALVRLRSALTAASAAQRAGEATTYTEALTLASTAAQDVARAIRPQ